MREEQRDTRRKAVSSVEVVLSTDERDKRPCRIRDMNLSGAFVECEQMNLHDQDRVELDLTLSEEGAGTRHHRVPAQVIRVAEDGAALRFRQVDIDTFSSILGLLYVRK